MALGFSLPMLPGFVLPPVSTPAQNYPSSPAAERGR